jgi:hypothetical protein
MDQSANPPQIAQHPQIQVRYQDTVLAQRPTSRHGQIPWRSCSPYGNASLRQTTTGSTSPSTSPSRTGSGTIFLGWERLLTACHDG